MSIDLIRIAIYAVALLVLLWRIKACYKKGFAGELLNAFSMAAACLAGYFLYGIAVNFLAGHFGRIFGGLLYLSILLVIYRIFHLILASVKLFAKLPVVKGIDKILGIVLGIIEAAAIMIAFLSVLPILMDLDWISIGENVYEKMFEFFRSKPWHEWKDNVKAFVKDLG